MARIVKILGKSVVFEEERVPLEKLLFFPDNPRIYSIISKEKEDAASDKIQEKIYQTLREREHVKKLAQSIKRHGGLIEPLIVKDEVFEVLEGNSRLAACRMINESPKSSDDDKESIRKLPCEIISQNISEELIFAFLGEHHIIGKTNWDAYEKANYVYRRLQIAGDPKRVSREIGESIQEINTLSHNIILMEAEPDIKRYSYYDAFNRSPNARKEIGKYVDGEGLLIKTARNYKGTAQQFRERLKETLKSPKAKKAFFENNSDLDEAFEIAESSGSTDAMFQKMKKFRQFMEKAKPNLKTLEKTDSSFGKINFEIKKLDTLVQNCHAILQKKDGA